MTDWWRRRRARRAEELEVRRRLLEEYVEKFNTGDPDTREASRDWADNDAAPWRMEVGLASIFVVLIVSITVLVLLFSGIKALVGG